MDPDAGAWAATRAVLTSVAVVLFYAYFYRVAVARWGRVVQPLIDRMGLAQNHSTRDVEAVGKLAAAGAAQAGFATVLLVALQLDAGSLLSQPSPAVLGLAVALGLAEISFAAWLASVIGNAVAHFDPIRGGAWLAGSRGGWMGQFRSAVRAAPQWLGLTSVGLYVLVEEIVFRGVVIEVMRPFGFLPAICVSGALFVGVQAFNMPGLGSALYPMVGAAVIGVVHGAIIWQVAGVLPLAVAHATFFAGALMASRQEPDTWRP